MDNGNSHDLDDLSSGEKELIHGYITLVALGLKNSIVMIDEPEVHLNPRMVKGLVGFYDNFVSKEFNNQIIFSTHSDVLVKDLISTADVMVMHMGEATEDEGNQVVAVNTLSKKDKLIYELVGDRAAFLPAGKVVIIEGDKSSLDRHVLDRLFPDFVAQTNIISGLSKKEVILLAQNITDLESSSDRLSKVFAITDRDFDTTPLPSFAIHHWNVYSIENYLLHPDYILRVLNALGAETSHDQLLGELGAVVQTVEKRLVRESQINAVASRLFSSTKINIDVNSSDFEGALMSAFEKAKERVGELSFETNENDNTINLKGQNLEEKLMVLPGKKILAEFVAKNEKMRKYGVRDFSALIVDKMQEDGYQPEGIRTVLASVSSS